MNGHELIPVTVAGALAFGAVLAFLGGVKSALAKRLGVDEAQGEGLLAAFNLGLIPLMLAAGVVVDYAGVRGVLTGSSLLLGMAVFALSLARSYGACLAAALLVATATAGLHVATVKLMPQAFFEGNPAASLNLGLAFSVLGALVVSPLTELLLYLGLRRTLVLAAAGFLLPAAIAALTPSPAIVFPAPEEGALGQVLGTPGVWLAGLAFMLYGTVEGSIAAWTTGFLRELGHRESRAPVGLWGFWLAFLGSRVVASSAQEHLLSLNSGPWFILLLALLAGVLLGNLAGAPPKPSLAWGVAAVGALLGPIFPTLAGVVLQKFDAAEQGTAYGATFALGAAGSLVFSRLAGAYARRHNPRSALRAPAFAALLLAAAALVLGVSMSTLLF
jgi:hypothetical protein